MRLLTLLPLAGLALAIPAPEAPGQKLPPQAESALEGNNWSDRMEDRVTQFKSMFSGLRSPNRKKLAGKLDHFEQKQIQDDSNTAYRDPKTGETVVTGDKEKRNYLPELDGPEDFFKAGADKEEKEYRFNPPQLSAAADKMQTYAAKPSDLPQYDEEFLAFAGLTKADVAPSKEETLAGEAHKMGLGKKPTGAMKQVQLCPLDGSEENKLPGCTDVSSDPQISAIVEALPKIKQFGLGDGFGDFGFGDAFLSPAERDARRQLIATEGFLDDFGLGGIEPMTTITDGVNYFTFPTSSLVTLLITTEEVTRNTINLTLLPDALDEDGTVVDVEPVTITIPGFAGLDPETYTVPEDAFTFTIPGDEPRTTVTLPPRADATRVTTSTTTGTVPVGQTVTVIVTDMGITATAVTTIPAGETATVLTTVPAMLRRRQWQPYDYVPVPYEYEHEEPEKEEEEPERECGGENEVCIDTDASSKNENINININSDEPTSKTMTKPAEHTKRPKIEQLVEEKDKKNEKKGDRKKEWVGNISKIPKQTQW